MTIKKMDKSPFPWFGGKSKAAPVVWSLLGDVAHYVEPFAGSLAVLLKRPHPCNRPYYSESVNDLDGFIVNAWRSMQMHPAETATAASWPVAEADKQARQIHMLRWKQGQDLEHLMGDPYWCDPVIGGWWIWAVCAQIGAFTNNGAWTMDQLTGRIYKQDRTGPRQPGVVRGLPFMGNDGRGVNHSGTRARGVSNDTGFHPVTMPELTKWFEYLSARLRHVRIMNGDWKRICSSAVLQTLVVLTGTGYTGVFLDPPYATTERVNNLYANDDGNVAAECLAWCLKNGDNPKYRIVLAGYDTEHAELTAAGWTEHLWWTAGLLSSGMGSTNQQDRERLWASPHCIKPKNDPDQYQLFAPEEQPA